ncbi:MAG: hypothetical protein QUS08_05000, partial [Methanothrix sp.]|nr:hypothetical protein [Methanothrix sp.]
QMCIRDRLAEAALLRKGQRPLMDGRLEASMVYEGLRQISLLRGPQSMHRKAAILRGLLLEASPLEGKYIARTALRRMLAGIGPGTMISAISMAFGRDQQEVRGAYAIMPDMGLLAELALSHELGRISIRPGVPIVPMRASRGDARTPGRFLPMYPGIRVQVHRAGRQVRAFTSRLRDVTALLRGMAQDIPDKEMIIDAHLIGFRDGEICSQEEMLRYIKRERLARRSTIQPAILAYDLIYLDGMDLTGRGYEKRRRMLEELLGQPKPLPFQGISPANEWLILEREVVAELLGQVRGAGGRMLVERDPEAPYLPGRRERGDLILVGGR